MSPTARQRFAARVVASGECHVWTGYIDRHGYGNFSARTGQRVLAHRAAWVLAGNPDPGDQRVLHRCDNPACVRVEHLFLGSDADNVADMIAKGRDARGERNGSARLTDELVRRIRSLADEGLGQRAIAERVGIHQSRVCRVLAGKAWRHVA